MGREKSSGSEETAQRRVRVLTGRRLERLAAQAAPPRLDAAVPAHVDARTYARAAQTWSCGSKVRMRASIVPRRVVVAAARASASSSSSASSSDAARSFSTRGPVRTVTRQPLTRAAGAPRPSAPSRSR
jgi:hypothetical protein